MTRAFLFTVSTLLALSGLAPAVAQTDDWRAPVLALLEQRARAVLDGDEAAFMATMEGAPRTFREQRRTWFFRMQDLPVDRYALEPGLHTYEDLAPALARLPAGDEVHVIEVDERMGLAGYDAEPALETIYFTVVRRGDRWSIVADEDLEDLGLLSARAMWDFAPVRITERDGVMVIYQGNRSQAEQIRDATIDAGGRVQDDWPLRWRPRVVVMIPRSADDLARILGTTIDLGPFVAFAASNAYRDAQGSYDLVGYRIFVQPETFFGYSRSFQAETLGHEMLHYATRPIAGAFTTSWLEEGVAQIFGERGSLRVPDLARDARSISGLPEDHRFFIGPNIHRSYQASAHFMRYVRDRFGTNRAARFYRAVGAESTVSLGTDRYHLDRAARRVLDTGFDALERAWLRSVREEF